MKAINAKTLVQAVTIIRNIETSTATTGQGRAALQEMFEACHDRHAAAALAKACLEQAILVGLCEVRKLPDGKRDDRTSNVKRCLAGAMNNAYTTSETFSLVTKGKGVARTCHIEWKEKTEKTAKEKFLARLNNLLLEVNATETESKSLTTRFTNLYDEEQARQIAAKTEMQEKRQAIELDALNAITATCKAKLESRFGRPASEEEIAAAVAMAV